MHPASPFIKPKYFKTRVKERKERAQRGRFVLYEKRRLLLVTRKGELTMKIGKLLYATKE